MTERSAPFPLKVQMGPVTPGATFTLRCSCGYAADVVAENGPEATSKFFKQHFPGTDCTVAQTKDLRHGASEENR